MRVLITDLKTGRYFRRPDQWTPRKDEATDFGTGVRAIQAASDLKLKGVEMLLSFEDSRYDIRLPMSARPR
jgi:hypothetical protein